MYNFIKTIAPLVIVAYLSTFIAGPAFGEPQISAEVKLYSLDDSMEATTGAINNPLTDQVFKMEVKLFYNGEQVKNVAFKNPEFKVIRSYSDEILDHSYWNSIFILKAPAKAGDYACTFEGTSRDGNQFTFTNLIKVSERQNWWLTCCCLASVGCLAILIGGAGSSKGCSSPEIDWLDVIKHGHF